MIVIGVDAHKRTHTMVAVDAGGKKLGEKTVEATTSGHLAAIRWAQGKFGSDVTWAVEDTRAMTARLERDLMTAGGQAVLRVPTQLMARTRSAARSWGKSDPIDALATARAALREPDLPVARHHPVSRELKLLVERRDDLVKQRTATMQRLLWRIHELEPEYRIKPGGLIWRPPQEALAHMLSRHVGLVAELAREELTEVVRLTPAIRALEKRLETRIRTVASSLLELYGCGALTAARIVGETADVSRFRSEAAFARYAGLAPVPNWSGATQGRMRSYRGGNRQLNAALHQIAMTQIKTGGPAEQYYRRRRGERDEHGYAITGVKRRIARTVFKRLRADQEPASGFTIDELRRSADEWQAAVRSMDPDLPPRDALPQSYSVTSPIPLTDPRLAPLVQVTDEFEALVRSMEHPTSL